ncbi:hypothetical protein Taro_034078 [Colocasia esculenta]|uniref:Uncharacterized protein n=1 Tax=Colocasia esculenta TaxID=4460 RepID=A0A843VQC8_COLES|nr:hypothetical protein [Colocasia esculenta]
MGNGNVSGLGDPAQDVSDGALEPSPSSSHETGLRSSEAAPAELENVHERKASVTDSYTSEADHNLVQMKGLNQRAEDEEGKHSCTIITLDAGETFPNPSVAMASDINGNINKEFSSTEEVTATGIDIMTKKLEESSREHDPCNSNMDWGDNTEEVVTKENETNEWVSISEEAEAHELIVLGEHKVADENTGGFEKRADIMGEYSINSIFHVPQEEDFDEEEILLKVFNSHKMVTSTERNIPLQEPESLGATNVVCEGSLANQSGTENGEYYQSGPISQDIIRELQLDSSRKGHESFVFLEAIDAQIKDTLMREKEEAETASQLEEYESIAALTAIFGRNEECPLMKEETTGDMCRSTGEYEVDGHLGKGEEKARKILSSEGYEFDKNHTAAPINHEEYLSGKQVQVDNTPTFTIELEGTSPITVLEEEKSGQFRSKEAIVQITLTEDIVCETKCMHQNEHFDSEKHNKSCHEENNVNTDVYCEANSKFMLTENDTKGESVILEESHSLQDTETESSFSPIVTVERIGVVEKDELLIVKEDNVIEEIRLTGESLDQPLKEQPSTTNSAQIEKLVYTALSTSENIENNEKQSPLSSMVNVEKAIEDRVERELLIVKRGNVAEEISVDDPLEGEPSLTNLVQEQQSVKMSLVMEAAISPQPCLSVQDRDWDQPCNVSSEYVTESRKSWSPMQSEVEEYKEMVVTESDQVICGGKAENSGQQSDDFSFDYFEELREIDTKEQSKVTEKEEFFSKKLEPENCIVMDFDVRECSDINFERLEPNVLSVHSPIEEKDVAHLLDVKDPFVNRRVTNDTKDTICLTESYLDGYGVITLGEGTKFSTGDLIKDPLTFETVSEVENIKASHDEEEETQVQHGTLHQSCITSCGSNEQLDESVGQPREDFRVAPVDHDGLGSSNNYHGIPNYDIQSMTKLNNNVLNVDLTDCGDSGDFEKLVKKSESSTPEQFEDDYDRKPEDELQSDNKLQQEVKFIIVEHQSAQDSIFRNNKSEGDECQGPLQELPTIELNEEIPSMEIYESRNVSKYAMKNTMETEASTATTDRGTLDSIPSQHMTGVKGLISVFESSSIDAELNSKNAISDLQVLQVKSSKADSIFSDQCGSYTTQIRILSEGDTWPQSNMRNAKANLPAIEVRNEESDQNQKSLQQKSSEEVPSTPGRTSSEKLKAPLLRFFKNEINIVKSQEKGDSAMKNAADKTGSSSSKKPMATPSRRHENYKSKSSFFSTCMCCTTDV